MRKFENLKKSLSVIVLIILILSPQNISAQLLTNNTNYVPVTIIALVFTHAILIFFLLRNIYKRKQNEKLISNKEKERSNFILKGTKAGTFDWDMRENKMIINERMANMFGYKLLELEPIGFMTWRNYMHKDDLPIIDEILGKIANKEIENLELEYRLKHKYGNYVWLHVKGSVVNWDEAGNPTRLSGINIDITEKKLAEIKLLEQRDKFHQLSEMYELINKELRITSSRLFEVNNRYEHVINAANIGTFEVDLKTGRIVRNKVAANMIGFELSEIGEDNNFWASRIHSTDKSCFDSACGLKNYNESSSFNVTYRMKHKNDSWVWINCIGKVSLTDINGKPLKVSGVTQDVTQTKESEIALIENNKRFKNMFSKSKTIMFVIDPGKKTIVDANESALNFYGYSEKELIGMKVSNINRISNEQMTEEMNNAMKEKRNYFLFEHHLKSGEVRNVEVYTSPITVNRKLLLHSVIIDVTNTVKAQNELKLINKRFKGLDNIIHFKAESTNELLEYTLKECIEYTQSDIGAIYHFNSSKNLFLLNNLVENMSLCVNKIDSLDYGVMDCLNKCIKNRESIIINDPEDDYEFIKGQGNRDRIADYSAYPPADPDVQNSRIRLLS